MAKSSGGRGFKSLPLLVTASLAACGGGDISPPTTAQPDLPVSTFLPTTSFTNVTASSGISHTFGVAGRTVETLTGPERMAGGVAAADIDDDGDIDLYFVAGNATPNHLYRNDGDNQFTDVAASYNLDLNHMGSGPTFADIDGDSDPDLFIGAANSDEVFLFRRDGDQYVNVTAQSGILISAENTFSATFADYDGDADLDLFMTHWNIPGMGDTEHLWQNNGDGTFTSASVSSNLASQMLVEKSPGEPPRDYTFTANFTDFDQDGDQDILVAADFITSQVVENNGDGTFTVTTDRDVITDDSGMGAAVGDYDNDGDMDWFVTAIYEDPAMVDRLTGNRLYQNQGDGTFIDVTESAGVGDGGWGWGACMADFDNDGDLDIFHTNGIDSSQGQAGGFLSDQVRYFENQGDGTFVASATAAGLLDVGQGRGIVCFDSDRDGDLDILISNNNFDQDANVLYRNDLAPGPNYLTVKLDDTSLNTQGIGAWIEVTGGGETQVREMHCGSNFVSQNPAEVHFGLGNVDTVDISVRWPDGTASNFSSVAANQLLVLSKQ